MIDALIESEELNPTEVNVEPTATSLSVAAQVAKPPASGNYLIVENGRNLHPRASLFTQFVPSKP